MADGAPWRQGQCGADGALWCGRGGLQRQIYRERGLLCCAGAGRRARGVEGLAEVLVGMGSGGARKGAADSGGASIEGGVSSGPGERVPDAGARWDAWGGTLMAQLEIQRMPAGQEITAQAVAEISAKVRAQIRKRGQGKKSQGSMFSPTPRPCTAPAPSTVTPRTAKIPRHRTGDLSAKLGSQYQILGSAAASRSMQRTAARSHLGLLSPMTSTASAFLPVQLSPSLPASPRRSDRSKVSGWVGQSARSMRTESATVRSKCTQHADTPICSQ